MASKNLGDIRTPGQILRFAVPTIIVMVSISTYSIVDGALISNIIGTDALAGLNIIMPVCGLLSAFGFMFSTGGSAYVATKMGEGENEKANRAFSGIVLTAVAVSAVTAAAILVYASPLVDLMGADDTIRGYALDYMNAYMLFAPLLIIQFLATQFLIVAGRPGLSLAGSLGGGIANVILDIVLMGPLDMGMRGAAVASGIGSAVPFAVGAAYFVFGKNSPVRFVRPSFERRMLAKTCSNGASEMVTELSGSVTTLLFNLAMMKYFGPDGVSAITILMYVQFLAIAVTMGYSMGVAPVMSYCRGAGDKKGMKGLFRISLTFIGTFSVAVFILLELFAGSLIDLFAGSSEHVMELAVSGAVIYSFAFLLMEFNGYTSSLFTSLSNGLVSAVISFIRGLCLLAPMIVILPMLMGGDGIWYAVPVTEAVTAVVSAAFIIRLGPRYGFMSRGTSS